MKKGVKLLLSLFLMSSSVVAFAANYVDGIEYFNAGQPDRAKILLERTLNDEGTKQAESYYYLGEIAFGEKDYKAAADYYQKGFAADPTYPYNKVGEGKIALQNKDVKGGEKLFKEALKIKGPKKDKADQKRDEADLKLAIAKAYYETGTPGYVKYLNDSYKSDAQNPEYFVFMGDIEVDKKEDGYAGKAAGLYEAAISFDENCIEAYVKYAHIYFVVSPNLAIQMLETLQNKAPESALGQRELAEAYYKNYQFDKAAAAYEKYIQNPNHFATDRPRLATLLYFGKRYDESLALAKKILVDDPESFVLRRVVFYNQYDLGQTNEAEQAAVYFFGMNPGNNQFVVRDYTTYGDILQKQKKYEEAIAQYEKARELDGNNSEVLKMLSSAYNRNRNYEQAIALFEQYMAADSVKNQKTMDFYNLGQICYAAAQNTPDSLAVREEYLVKGDSCYQTVIEKAPKSYLGYMWRARINTLRDPETKEGLALPYYEALISFLDQDPLNREKPDAKEAYIEAYKYIGYYNYMKTVDRDLAVKKEAIAKTKEYWNKMLELAPNDQGIIEALEGLEK